MSYTIIKDSREQRGWTFTEYKECSGMEIGALKTGDYAIKELPDLVIIERKASPEEVAINLGKDIARFTRELERFKNYKYRYLICEFTLDEFIAYPDGTRIPHKNFGQVKMTGRFLMRRLFELQLEYDFQIIFAGNSGNGFLSAASIFKRIWEKHGKNRD